MSDRFIVVPSVHRSFAATVIDLLAIKGGHVKYNVCECLTTSDATMICGALNSLSVTQGTRPIVPAPPPEREETTTGGQRDPLPDRPPTIPEPVEPPHPTVYMEGARENG